MQVDGIGGDGKAGKGEVIYSDDEEDEEEKEGEEEEQKISKKKQRKLAVSRVRRPSLSTDDRPLTSAPSPSFSASNGRRSQNACVASRGH